MPRAKQKHQRMCTVAVTTLTGDELKLKVREQPTVHEVKCLIQQHWQAPLECQTIVVGETTPGDHEQLNTRLATSCNHLILTLLISCNERAARIAVLEALHSCQTHDAAPRMKFPQLMRDAILTSLQDTCSQVRARATKLLFLLAEKNNDALIASVLLCLSDQESAVVYGAIQAIPFFVEIGHEHAINEVLRHLRERDRRFNHNVHAFDTSPAWEVLPLITSKDEPSVVEAVISLTNAKANVLQILPKIATAVNECVLEVILSYVQDELSNVRSISLQVLPLFTQGCNRRVTNAILSCLEDPHEFVRLMAISALPFIEHECKQSVHTAVVAKLKDPDKRVVAQVLQSLQNSSGIFQDVDSQLIDEIGDLLKDADPRMRQSAKNLLEKLCEGRQDLLTTKLCAAGNIDKATFKRKSQRKFVLECVDVYDTSEECLSEWCTEDEQSDW